LGGDETDVSPLFFEALTEGTRGRFSGVAGGGTGFLSALADEGTDFLLGLLETGVGLLPVLDGGTGLLTGLARDAGTRFFPGGEDGAGGRFTCLGSDFSDFMCHSQSRFVRYSIASLDSVIKRRPDKVGRFVLLVRIISV